MIKVEISFFSSNILYILILAHISYLDSHLVILYNMKSVISQRLLQFSSVIQSCPTLCDPMDCSTPGFPVHHQLLEPTQTHVHRIGDAIQLSHPQCKNYMVESLKKKKTVHP